jgi:hypothetical protein
MACDNLYHLAQVPSTEFMMPFSFFGGMKRSGFNIGLSTNRLSKMMVDVLLQLPNGATNLKERVITGMGLIGQMSRTRDLNAAWDKAKRQVAREYPEKFILEGKTLRWNTGEERTEKQVLSTAGQRKLSALANKEGLTADELLTQLIAAYKASKKKR